MIALTDLEAAILAKVAREGSVTSYGIAKEFSESPSEFWSGSAGAIYPATRRMAERGLIVAINPDDGGHARIQYQLSREGKRAMKAWLLNVERAAGLGFDPLRSRLVNLHLATGAERKRFLAAVEARIEVASQAERQIDNPQVRAIYESVMKSRLAWIRTVRSLLE